MTEFTEQSAANGFLGWNSLVTPLDEEFRPAALDLALYRRRQKNSKESAPLIIAIGRPNGVVSRYETSILHKSDAESRAYAEWVAQFMLWSRGGSTLYVEAPREIADHIASQFRPEGPHAFALQLMEKIYQSPFAVILCEPGESPTDRGTPCHWGSQNNGCRLGVDLGGSEIKIVAIQDGETAFQGRFPWSPTEFNDVSSCFQFLLSVFNEASSSLPHLDAIGISTAGVVDENQLMVSNLMRGIGPDQNSRVQGIFSDLATALGVPITVTNDGEASALAGMEAIQEGSTLGMTLGTSLACGYTDAENHLTGWINELAFASIDSNPEAPLDDWSGYRGVGGSYFSINAVDRLLDASGIELDPGLPLQDRLATARGLAEEKDERAVNIYRTIGGYLAGTIPLFAEFYDVRNIVLMGGVTSGNCGETIHKHATATLKKLFPDCAKKVKLHILASNRRRMSQAKTAATLPKITVERFRPNPSSVLLEGIHL